MTNNDIIKMITEDEAILEKLNENPTSEEIVTIAKSKGLEITMNNAYEILASFDLPLSDDVLENVVGGTRPGGRSSFSRDMIY